jgi:hypothetical protein
MGRVHGFLVVQALWVSGGVACVTGVAAPVTNPAAPPAAAQNAGCRLSARKLVAEGESLAIHANSSGLRD